jgi:hypothetical protein
MKIYIAPSKALVQEKLRDWNEKFGSWGINCLELTGDNEFYNIKNIQEADIILTTPEVSMRVHLPCTNKLLMHTECLHMNYAQAQS